MKAARAFLTLLAAAALSACAVGPDYHAPVPPLAQTGPFVSARPDLTSPAAPAGDWWRLYANPTLDGLVQEALSHNRDLAVAAANLRQVRALVAEARATRLPSTTVTGSAERLRQPSVLTGLPVTGNITSVGFEAAYEVDLFGRVSRSIQAARADAGAAEAALEAAQVLVAAETASAYVEACGDNGQIAVAQQTANLFKQTADLTQRELDAGRGTGLDVAREQAEYENAMAEIPALESDRDAALFRLSVLLGRAPAQFPPEVRACSIIPELARPVPVGDGATLLKRRPDVRQAERRLAAATARIGVATADLYPSVSLGGSIATVGGEGARLTHNYQFSLGPLITWTFPNIVATQARVHEAGAAAEGALAAFQQANLAALQDAETALTAYGKALDRQAALRRARDQSQRAVDLSLMRQKEGLDSFLTVLDAQRTLANLQAQLAQQQTLTADDQVNSFKALGGGWPQAGVQP